MAADHSELSGHPFIRAALIASENAAAVGGDERTIGLIDGRPDSPLCLCGSRSFHSCDEAGEPMTVAGESRKVGLRRQFFEWPGLFACDSCGRLVDAATRAVVGVAAPTKHGEKAVAEDEQPVVRSRGRISAAIDAAISDVARLVGR